MDTGQKPHGGAGEKRIFWTKNQERKEKHPRKEAASAGFVRIFAIKGLNDPARPNPAPR